MLCNARKRTQCTKSKREGVRLSVPDLTGCTLPQHLVNHYMALCKRSRLHSSNIVAYCTLHVNTIWVHSISFPGSTPQCSLKVSPCQELIVRSHLPSRGDGMHLRSPPSDPLHKQGNGGLTQVSPIKAIRTYRGRPRLTQGS